MFNQVRYERAKEKGLDPFWNITVPEAVLRLKQGFGRLIRTPNDKGAFVLLDERILSKSYGSEFMQVFPEKLPVKVVLTKELSAQVKDFLALAKENF